MLPVVPYISQAPTLGGAPATRAREILRYHDPASFSHSRVAHSCMLIERRCDQSRLLEITRDLSSQQRGSSISSNRHGDTRGLDPRDPVAPSGLRQLDGLRLLNRLKIPLVLGVLVYINLERARFILGCHLGKLQFTVGKVQRSPNAGL